MKKTLSLEEMNRASAKEFTAALADIYEHSSWIPERCTTDRPFASLTELHTALVARLALATNEEKMSLLCAHPELAGREAQAGGLTSASSLEQACAKLNELSHNEMVKITELNLRYINKFSFPFIIAVLNHSKESIFLEFERRVENNITDEFETALAQVNQIAWFRLKDLFDEPA